MELSPKQQIAELIKKSERILVLGHKSHGGDLVGSMLALEKVLSAEGKEVSLVLSETVDSSLQFLPEITKISRDISGQRDLVISIAKKDYPVEKISYNDEGDALQIIVTPKAGNLTAKDLVVTEGSFKYDLIFVLDTPDVEKIDSVYDKYTELFFEVPIVNIDHHSGNEYFGTVNLVDMTATSTAEILVSIIEAMGPNKFDADVATCLLTGLIADTASFKNTNTTPKALTISAQMLAAGARQQEIIQNLYKTRPVSTLKLWGRVLSNLEYESDRRMIWSAVTAADLAESNTSSEVIRSVLDELLASAPGTDVVMVLAEENNKIVGYLKGLNGQDVLSIAEAFDGHGSALSAEFSVGKANLLTHKQSIIDKILSLRDKQLGKIDPIVPKPSLPEMTIEKREQVVIPPLAQPIIEERDTVVAGSSPITEPEAKKDESVVVVTQAEKIVARPAAEALVVDTDPIPEFTEETVENEPTYEEIFEALTAPIVEEPEVIVTKEDPIEKAILSIDNEIETGPTVPEIPETPNVDVEDAKSKDEALRQIGEVMRGYTPGKALGEKGNQPIDTSIWK